MKLGYFGHSCFALESEAGTRVVTDPYGDVGLTLPPLCSDIVTVSHSHYDHCNTKAVSSGAVFDRAGEFSCRDISFRAFLSWHDGVRGALRGKNLIFRFLIDGMFVVHLGDSGVKAEDLPEGLSPDILLIPVGGHYTIRPEEAVRYIERLRPAIAVPMHYKVMGLTVDIQGVDAFCEFAREKFPVLRVGDTLSLTREALPQSSQIIIMER